MKNIGIGANTMGNEEKTFIEKLGFCRHRWKFDRTNSSDYRIIDVCECEKCGKRKGFRVW